jgi:peptidylprolyl isomerase
MAQAQNGDKVRVNYVGTLEDGTVFDSSLERDPMDFTIGDDQLIPGFQNAVVGMTQGDKKTVNIKADEAYGPYQEQLVQEIAKSNLPADLEVERGTRLSANDGQGNTIPVTVVEVKEETITLDANHPLAGEDLTFEITLVDIIK